MKTKLVQKIVNRDIVVGVVGLGYVGLPLAVEKAKAGFKTIGFDVQEEKVNLVNEGHNYIGDVVDSDLKKLVEAGMLQHLNLATYHNSLARSTKSTWSLALPLLVSIRFQVLFHSPPGVLFTFPSRYCSLSVTR